MNRVPAQLRSNQCAAMCVLLVYLLLSSSTAQAGREKDTITTRTAVGPLVDFDGDGQKDTLYFTLQSLENKGKARKTRKFPGFIVWSDSGSKKDPDTTSFDFPKDASSVVGMRIADLNKDDIQDIELIYRWRETSGEKLIKEKLWLIAGGSDLRAESVVKLADAKKNLTAASDVLSVRSESTRGAEQSVSIGSYAIRRIRENVQMPKAPIEHEVFSTPSSSIVNVFPNPASDQISISWIAESVATTVEITNVQGRLVSTRRIDPNMSNTRTSANDLKNESSLDVDIRALAAGVYTVRILGCDSCPLTSQFIVVR